jgi:hypothetical protein
MALRYGFSFSSTIHQNYNVYHSLLGAVLSFGLTCFGLGYSFGKDNNKTQK